MVITEKVKRLEQIPRFGGAECLDFTNTLDWRGRNDPIEFLRDYDDLLAWSALVGTVTWAQARTLGERTGKAAKGGAFSRAITFREASYRTLRALVAAKTPDEKDIATINAAIAEARAHAHLRYNCGCFSWSFAGSESDADYPLWKIALSLADILTSKPAQVRLCGGPECGWLFLDATKNHTRRWCSMEGCGNRAKARRHYARIS